jgi:hypothetical protein
MPIIALNQSLNEALTHCTSDQEQRIRMADLQGTQEYTDAT